MQPKESVEKGTTEFLLRGHMLMCTQTNVVLVFTHAGVGGPLIRVIVSTSGPILHTRTI